MSSTPERERKGERERERIRELPNINYSVTSVRLRKACLVSLGQ